MLMLSTSREETQYQRQRFSQDWTAKISFSLLKVDNIAFFCCFKCPDLLVLNNRVREPQSPNTTSSVPPTLRLEGNIQWYIHTP